MNSNIKIFSIISTVTFALIFLCSQALAGLVIERIYAQGPKSDKKNVTKMVSYFQDNKVKTIEPNGDYTIVDLDKGTMTMVDTEKKEYYSTTLDAMLQQMQKGMDKIKAHLKGLSPEQRSMIEKMMGMSQGSGTKLSLKKVADSQKIAGYEAEHYVISQNGKKVGEYWVSKQLRNKMYKELDKDKIEKFEKAMSNISNQLNVFGKSSMTELMDMEEKLQKKGEIVKQIHYPNTVNMNMEGSFQEVVSVKEENIPPSAFTVPKDFKHKSAQQH